MSRFGGAFCVRRHAHIYAYRNAIALFVVVAAIIGFTLGCTTNKHASGGDAVRVVDGTSGKPVPGISVVVIPPTGAGTPAITDNHGIAHIQVGFGNKEDRIHIQASMPDGPMTSVGLWGVATNYVEIKMGPFKI
jgi:hypothetical protein